MDTRTLLSSRLARVDGERLLTDEDFHSDAVVVASEDDQEQLVDPVNMTLITYTKSEKALKLAQGLDGLSHCYPDNLKKICYKHAACSLTVEERAPIGGSIQDFVDSRAAMPVSVANHIFSRGLFELLRIQRANYSVNGAARAGSTFFGHQMTVTFSMLNSRPMSQNETEKSNSQARKYTLNAGASTGQQSFIQEERPSSFQEYPDYHANDSYDVNDKDLTDWVCTILILMRQWSRKLLSIIQDTVSGNVQTTVERFQAAGLDKNMDNDLKNSVHMILSVADFQPKITTRLSASCFEANRNELEAFSSNYGIILSRRSVFALVTLVPELQPYFNILTEAKATFQSELTVEDLLTIWRTGRLKAYVELTNTDNISGHLSLSKLEEAQKVYTAASKRSSYAANLRGFTKQFRRNLLSAWTEDGSAEYTPLFRRFGSAFGIKIEKSIIAAVEKQVQLKKIPEMDMPSLDKRAWKKLLGIELDTYVTGRSKTVMKDDGSRKPDQKRKGKVQDDDPESGDYDDKHVDKKSKA